MLESFNFYLKRGKVVKQNISPATVKSLFVKAEKRLDYIKRQKINEQNTDFIFEDVYEAMREAAQSLLAKAGYKPYSHEALIAFIKEKYPQFNPREIEKFDEYRKTRNQLVYYAESTSVEKTKEALELLEKILAKIEAILKEDRK
ncbi:HEPN domain-containing protein [Candidatus Woesearchaeota archaeon]|nr:HEPN domain-containing protein [Candidatus Woesearchaeota archaeon]